MLSWICLGIALIAVGLALHFWHQKSGLYQILLEGAKGYEQQRVRIQSLERSLQKLETEYGERVRVEEMTRKSLSQASAQAASLQGELERERTDFARRLRNTELQRDHILQRHDHLKSEVEDLSVALATATEERRLAQALLKDVNPDLVKRLTAENVELRRRVDEGRRDLAQLKSAQTIHPRDFDTLKRKVGQYELLYSGMKGLRDMVDERNKNWEDGLLKLARWILTSSPLAKADDPVLDKGIGPIVGEALQRIGADLVGVGAHDEMEAERKAVMDLEQRVGARSDAVEARS